MTPQQLLDIRELTGLSQSAFGEKIGQSREAISSQECGRRNITKMQIKLIEKCFRKAFTEVMG